MKQNLKILVFIFLIGFLSIYPNLTPSDSSETTATTFPVHEAGIAAYVKVENIEKLTIEDLNRIFSTAEKQGKTYIIGRVPVTNNPLVYIGLDGWVVAYFLKTEEVSKIVGKEKTTLEEAIEYVTKELNLTYSSPIRYYDFEFPEANRITVAIKNKTGDLYLAIPGTLYEASYKVDGFFGTGMMSYRYTFKVDDTVLFEGEVWATPVNRSGEITNYLTPEIGHRISLTQTGGWFSGYWAIVLIYKS